MKKFVKPLLILSLLPWLTLAPVSAASNDYLCSWNGNLDLYRYFHWYDHEFPIQVYIHDVPDELNVKSKQSLMKTVKSAFKAWTNKYSKIKFEFVKEAKYAQIVVTWRNTFPGASPTWGQALLPQPFKSNGRIYHRSKLNLAVRAQANTSLTGVEVEFSPTELLAIATHEVGHALGLLHDPKNRDNLMYPGYLQLAVNSPRTITSEDLATLKRLYSFKEDLRVNPCK